MDLNIFAELLRRLSQNSSNTGERVGLELEAALLGDVRVRVQCDVGDRVALGDEVAAATQPCSIPASAL